MIILGHSNSNSLIRPILPSAKRSRIPHYDNQKYMPCFIGSENHQVTPESQPDWSQGGLSGSVSGTREACDHHLHGQKQSWISRAGCQVQAGISQKPKGTCTMYFKTRSKWHIKRSPTNTSLNIQKNFISREYLRWASCYDMTIVKQLRWKTQSTCFKVVLQDQVHRKHFMWHITHVYYNKLHKHFNREAL